VWTRTINGWQFIEVEITSQGLITTKLKAVLIEMRNDLDSVTNITDIEFNDALKTIVG